MICHGYIDYEMTRLTKFIVVPRESGEKGPEFKY